MVSQTDSFWKVEKESNEKCLRWSKESEEYNWQRKYEEYLEDGSN